VLLLAALLACGCSGGAQASAEEIEQGRKLYAANGCGTCHGQTGRGDGPVGKTLTPPPRDFRDAAAFKNGSDPSSVANTIATGLTRDGGQMQSYNHLSDRERHLLARFVISLRESTAPADVAGAGTLRVSDAWVREPVPGRLTTAAYAELENAGRSDVEIVTVAPDVAVTVELHEMTRTGDIMRMSPVKRMAISAGRHVSLAPGGLHLMLFDLTKPLKAGDAVTLTFTTSAGDAVPVAATVKGPEARP
jgi:copper(I)-binding protein